MTGTTGEEPPPGVEASVAEPAPPDGAGAASGSATLEPSARRSSALVAAGIVLSRVAGLVRERIIGAQLGVGIATDAFRAALRIPNLLQNLLGEGVLSASFIPVYARLLHDGDEEEAGRVAGAVAGLLAVVSGVLVVLGVVFAVPITKVLAPGFTGRRFDLTVTLTRIMFPGVGLLVLSAWCLGVLNSHRRFFLSYVAPVLWNVVQIGALTFAALRGFDQTDSATALAWGVLAGGVAQLAVQLPAVRRLVRHLRLSVRTDVPGVRTAINRFLPVVASRGVVQLSGYVDLLLASLLVVGAVSVLGYAQIFYLLPISLFGMSVAAAELPELSRLAGRDGRHDDLQRRLADGLARIAFFVVPTAVAYLVVGDLLVGALLQVGRFGEDETRLVWFVLGAYTVGLLASTASRLLQNVLYAVGDTRTPSKAAVARVVVAAALGAVLMFQLDRIQLGDDGLFDLVNLDALPAPLTPLDESVRGNTAGPLHLGAVGLALASGLAGWLELGLLRRRVRDTIGPVRLGGGQLGRTTVAALAAAVAGLATRPVADALPVLVGGGVAALVFGLVYLGAATALRVPEAGALTGSVRRRLGRR